MKAIEGRFKCTIPRLEQKTTTNNPRSTIGTSTEIFDYLKLLFARVGKTYSPISNKEVIQIEAMCYEFMSLAMNIKE